jgi:hypothetical protein
VSWAAHDLEPYAFQRHLNLKVAFVPLLIAKAPLAVPTSGRAAVPGVRLRRHSDTVEEGR